jgi:hypothetical protein
MENVLVHLCVCRKMLQTVVGFVATVLWNAVTSLFCGVPRAAARDFTKTLPKRVRMTLTALSFLGGLAVFAFAVGMVVTHPDSGPGGAWAIFVLFTGIFMVVAQLVMFLLPALAFYLGMALVHHWSKLAEECRSIPQ